MGMARAPCVVGPVALRSGGALPLGVHGWAGWWCECTNPIYPTRCEVLYTMYHPLINHGRGQNAKTAARARAGRQDDTIVR